MAHGFGRPTDFDTLLVFDLGGGTLDISVLETFEGILEVRKRGRRAVAASTHYLGGGAGGSWLLLELAA